MGIRDQFHLNQAAKNGNLDEVKRLLNGGKKIDINLRNEEGYNALMYSASEGYLDIVEYLVLKGADLNLGNKKGRF
jgi:ankyrin repeat protein